MRDAGDPGGAETGGDVTPFSDNPDIRKRFGIKQDTAWGASYPGLGIIAKLATVLELDPAELLRAPPVTRKPA